MSFKANFYTFSKKKNSTAQPTGSGTEYSIILKEECSIMNPVITMKVTGNPTIFNYCHIAQFNRWYFVNDWTYGANGLWYATLSIDVLATYKTAIGNSNTYIVRAASASNGDIIDTLYPAKASFTIGTNSATNPFPYQIGDSRSCFIIGIIGSGTHNIGGVTYYKMDRSEFNEFCHYLFSNYDSWLDVRDISASLAKGLINPLEYVVSCEWMPARPPGASVGSNVPIGWWNVPMSAASNVEFISASATATGSFSIDIPSHPQSARGSYLNVAPYTRLTLEFEPFGTFALDTTYYKNASKVYVYYSIDAITGMGTVWVSPTDSRDDFTETRTAKVSVPIQLAQYRNDIVGTVGSAVSIVGGLMTGNVLQQFEGCASALGSMLPQMQTSGSNGGFSAFQYAPKLVYQFTNIADEDNAHFGRPLMANRTINTLSGYIKCADGDVSISATEPELEAIKNYMEGGFFYE